MSNWTPNDSEEGVNTPEVVDLEQIARQLETEVASVEQSRIPGQDWKSNALWNLIGSGMSTSLSGFLGLAWRAAEAKRFDLALEYVKRAEELNRRASELRSAALGKPSDTSADPIIIGATEGYGGLAGFAIRAGEPEWAARFQENCARLTGWDWESFVYRCRQQAHLEASDPTPTNFKWQDKPRNLDVARRFVMIAIRYASDRTACPNREDSMYQAGAAIWDYSLAAGEVGNWDMAEKCLQESLSAEPQLRRWVGEGYLELLKQAIAHRCPEEQSLRYVSQSCGNPYADLTWLAGDYVECARSAARVLGQRRLAKSCLKRLIEVASERAEAQTIASQVARELNIQMDEI